MPLQKLKEDIRKNNVAPYYYFYGEEKFLVDKAVAMLKKYLISKGLEDFNLDKLSCAGSTADDILSAQNA